MLWMRIPSNRQRSQESEGELRASLLKQIQEFRNTPTAYGSLASLFETLQSTTLKRVMGEHLAQAEVGGTLAILELVLSRALTIHSWSTHSGVSTR